MGKKGDWETSLFDLMAMLEGEDNWHADGIEISWQELVGDILESSFQSMYTLSGYFRSEYRLPSLHLFRLVSEIISGQNPQKAPVPAADEFSNNFTKIRSRMSKKFIQAPGPSIKDMAGDKPALIMASHSKNMVVAQLRKDFPVSKDIILRKKISGNDIEDYFTIRNPLYQMVVSIYQTMERALRPRMNKKKEDQADRLFLDGLEKQRVLHGKGKYKNFSIRFYRNRGRSAVRLILSLGNKPFLQQVSSKPAVFIFWDLKKYPISVFFQQHMSDDEIDLANIGLYAQCRHTSIWRHAFIKRTQKYPPVGSICMEYTNWRILALHRRYSRFNPAACLIEQLRAAARILRYGVRERDRQICQHNDFRKVPENEYQAVIKGWTRARRFAQEHDAEIVPYAR
jgi:hypothetical protein